MMCTSTSTIAYGIIIKTWTLLVAAQAFKKIKPILLALEMILLRKKNGILIIDGVGEGKKNIGDLPVEIIELVKKDLFSTINMKGEAQEYLKGLCCSRKGFYCEECDLWHHSKHTLGSDYSELMEGDCEACGERIFNFTGNGLEIGMFTDILGHYGLIPSTNDFITGKDIYDLNKSFLTVSIPISSSSIHSDANPDSYRSSATPLYFDTSNIDCAGGASRFQRLVTDWDLKLYDEPVQSMGQLGKKLEVVNDRSASLQEETSIKGKNNKVKKVKIEPKWMILSHTIDCQ